MEEIKKTRLFLYNLSSAGHALFDSILVFNYALFLLPPKELVAKGMLQYIWEKPFWGVLTVLGIVMLFARMIDGLADPFVGYFSDRSKSKFGRRRIFMLAAIFPLALSTVLIFYPPIAGVSIFNALYYAVIFGSCFLFYTMYVATYIALIPELGHTEQKRVGITTAQGFTALIGGALVMIGGPMLISWAQNMGLGLTDAYRVMAIILSVIGVIFLLLAVFAVDEKRFSHAEPNQTPFLESIRITLSNKPFIIFLIANMTLWYIFNTIRSSLQHITITLAGGSEADVSLYSIVVFGAAALFFMLVWYLVRKIGKKLVMLIGLAGFAGLSVLLALTGIIPLPANIWAFIILGLIGFPAAVFLTVPNVFISEVCDRDFEKTGQRREAMYFGVHGFFQTLNLGINTAALTFFFAGYGKDIANPLGVRLNLVFAAVLALVGFFVLLRYPDKEK